jgi:hypothetical protein
MSIHQSLGLLAGSLLLTLSAVSLLAQNEGFQKIKVTSVPITYTDPVSGPRMYKQYCAVCHGLDAKGHGPAAEALRTHPADLTVLARDNQGKFPALRVSSAINGDATVSAHGSKEMPVWGNLFYSLGRQRPGTQYEVQLRTSNLTDYVKSLQR